MSWEGSLRSVCRANKAGHQKRPLCWDMKDETLSDRGKEGIPDGWESMCKTPKELTGASFTSLHL